MPNDDCGNPDPHDPHEWYGEWYCPGVSLAMQTRCFRCLGEQYVLNVIPFSNGEAGCTVCGCASIPMSTRQWFAALRAARAEHRRAAQ